PAITGINAWTTSGTMMLFYLAALQAIPTDVYEAAAIDGAGPWRTFWKITFPLLKPGHFFVAVVSIIGAMKVFDQMYIISRGPGAAGSSVTAGIPGRATSERVQRIVAYVALFVFALLFFVPFLWSLSTSFKPLPETANFSLLPHHWTLAGYRDALSNYNFGRYMANSAILAGSITFTSVFLGALGVYRFAHFRF